MRTDNREQVVELDTYKRLNLLLRHIAKHEYGPVDGISERTSHDNLPLRGHILGTLKMLGAEGIASVQDVRHVLVLEYVVRRRRGGGGVDSIGDVDCRERARWVSHGAGACNGSKVPTTRSHRRQ